MIQAYVAEIDGLQDPKENPQLLDIFPENRRKKILSCRRKNNRLQSYGASLLLHRILNEHGKSMGDVFYSETGKPMIEGIFFSISHSANRVMCAVSSETVGCDIEKIKEGEHLEQRLEKVAKRFFSEHEVRKLEHVSEEERKSAFYQIWTMKEGYVKMTGEGLTIPLDCIEFDLDNGNVYRDGERCPCVVKAWESDGYWMSVCGREAEVKIVGLYKIVNGVIYYSDWSTKKFIKTK